MDSEGFNAVSNAGAYGYNPDRDGYASRNATFDLALPLADGHELGAKYLHNRQDAQYDGGPGYDDRTLTTLESWQLTSRNRLAPFWSSRLTAGQSSDDSVSQTGFGEFPFATRQRQLAWQNEFALPAGTLTAGYEWRQERRRHRRGVRRHPARHRLAVRDLPVARRGAGGAGQPAPRRVACAVRRPDDRRRRLRLPSRARVRRFTAGAATGFKAPSFNDLYYPGFSTPDLEPETARDVEAGLALGRAAGRWHGRRPGDRLPQPDRAADRVPLRTRASTARRRTSTVPR